MPDIIKKLGGFKEKLTNRPSQYEAAPAPLEVEKKIEIEQPQVVEEGKVTTEKTEAVSPVISPKAVPSPVAKSLALEKIEDVLEEDLEDIYFQLPAEKQAEFRRSGEETATKIELLIQ